jgi:hypothetical protein
LGRQNSELNLSSQYPVIDISYDFIGNANFFIPNFPGPDDFQLSVTLPDGFSISGVPEPSTWPMLLIGFAAIGFAGYRKSRRENFISTMSPYPNK